MKKILSSIMIFATLLMCSCGGKGGNPVNPDKPDEPTTNKKSKITLNLKATGSFQIVDKAPAVKSEVAIDPSNFTVEIYNNSGVLIHQWDKFSEMSEFIELTVANDYKIVAYNAKLQDVAFDAPFYYGETKFNVVLNQITPVDLVAKLGNVMISITPTQEFLTYYGEGNYKFIVRNDAYLTEGDPELIFNPGETRSGYVKAAPYTLTIFAGNTIQERYIENVNAQDHHIIKIDVKAVGSGGISIVVDRTVYEKNIDIIVPGDDEDLGNGGKPRPDTPESGEDPAPDIQLEVGNIDEPVVIPNTAIVDGVCTIPVKAIISSPTGISELRVKIDSPDIPEFILNGLNIPGKDYFDLANLDAEQTKMFIQFGVIKEGDVIKGGTSYQFDVTGFMSLLNPNERLHNFEVTVIDANTTSVVKTLSINRTE